jgi:hypothetical protein
MVAGFFMTGCALGVLLAWSFGKAKSGEHPAFALHLLYWHLPAHDLGAQAHAAVPPARAGWMKLEWLRADIASARRATTFLAVLLTGSLLVNVVLGLLDDAHVRP